VERTDGFEEISESFSAGSSSLQDTFFFKESDTFQVYRPRRKIKINNMATWEMFWSDYAL
jgi:hypothetical protein